MTWCGVCGRQRKPSELTEMTVVRERDGYEWTGRVCAECAERLEANK